MKFSGKIIWITGASSGIGEALAVAFAREGARLVLSARRESELGRVASRCGGAASIAIVPLDLGELGSLAQKVRDVLAKEGHVDVMVHNGGISQRSLARDTAVEVDERLLRVNHLGPVALTKALLPAMAGRGAGHFVVVSSLVGVFGTPLRSSYSASKHALHGFFDSLRAEEHDRGIRVTIVCPGFVRTDVSRNALSGDGSPHGVMDPRTDSGIEPDACARAIVDAVARGKREVYVGGRETLAVYAQRFAPGVFARLLRRVQSS